MSCIWKVYNNYTAAEAYFSTYKKARQFALRDHKAEQEDDPFDSVYEITKCDLDRGWAW